MRTVRVVTRFLVLLVFLLLLLVSLATLGCSAEVSHGLEESEANRIIAALSERGIPAETRAEGRQADRSWVVVVPSSERSKALLILRELELPDQQESGLAEVFDRGGLLPTPTEEQASLVRAVQGELVKTLESIDGVIAARVHLSLPAPHKGLIPAAQETPTTASVLVRYTTSSPPISNDQIRGIVAGAVTDLDPAHVTVVAVPQPQRVEGETCDVVALGPFAVSRSSLAPLRVWLGVTTLAIGLLGAMVVLLAFRVRTLRRQTTS